MSEKLTTIIDLDKYEDISIPALVNRLSRPDHNARDEEVASLVVKYFWLYCHANKKGATLGDITAFMQILEYYFAHKRFQGARFDFSELPSFIVPVFDFADKHGYALGMLGDVSSTTAIVKAIISQSIEAPSGSDFQGLDIGAGSGILALAQYILARRNSARNIRIDWLEQDIPVARRAESTLRSIVPGSVFHIHSADATRDHAYKKIPKAPNFVSIEMLPYGGSEMIAHPQYSSWANTHPDPLIPSVFALCRRFSNLVRANTFPVSIQTHLSLGRQDLQGDFNFPLSGERGLLNLSPDRAPQFALDVERIVIHGIQMNPEGGNITVGDIWSDLLQTPDNPSGWIKLFPLWLHRWKKMIHHNREYASLLGMYQGCSEGKRKQVPVMPPLRWKNTVSR